MFNQFKNMNTNITHTTEVVKYSLIPMSETLTWVRIPMRLHFNHQTFNSRNLFQTGNGPILRYLGITKEAFLATSHKPVKIDLTAMSATGTFEFSYKINDVEQVANLHIEYDKSLNRHHVIVCCDKPGIAIYAVYEDDIKILPNWISDFPMKLSPTSASVTMLKDVDGTKHAEVLFKSMTPEYLIDETSSEDSYPFALYKVWRTSNRKNTIEPLTMSKTEKDILNGFELRNTLDEFIQSIYEDSDSEEIRKDKLSIVQNAYHRLSTSDGGLSFDAYRAAVQVALDKYKADNSSCDELTEEYLDPEDLGNSYENMTNRELMLKVLNELSLILRQIRTTH